MSTNSDGNQRANTTNLKKKLIKTLETYGVQNILLHSNTDCLSLGCKFCSVVLKQFLKNGLRAGSFLKNGHS